MSRKRKLCNLTSYCRICLVRDACMTDIFSDNVKLSIKNLEKCTSFQIINKPDLPQNICHVCLYKLEMWNELITLFLKTNDKLNLNKENKKLKLDNESITSVKEAPEIEVVAQHVTNHQTKKLSSKKEEWTKRYIERKKALIGDFNESQSDSDIGDNLKLSPIQKARVATNSDKDAIKQRRIKKALKNLESNLADKYYIARTKIQVNDEEESKKSFRRVRSSSNLLDSALIKANDTKDNLNKSNKLNSNNNDKIIKNVITEKDSEQKNDNESGTNVTLRSRLKNTNTHKSKLIEVTTKNNFETIKNEGLTNQNKVNTNNVDDKKLIKSKKNNVTNDKLFVEKENVLLENNLSDFANDDTVFSCSELDQTNVNESEKNILRNNPLNISKVKNNIKIPQSQKSTLLTENGGTAQLVKSEIQLGNCSFIITSAVQLPKSLSVATNNYFGNNQSNNPNENQSNTLDISRVILQDHPHDFIQNCLKIEVEGMEYNILQRVQHELANYIDKTIPRNYLEHGEIITLNESTKNNQIKDTYSALNDQLKIIIGKVLKKNCMPDLSNRVILSKNKTISAAFAKAAEKSKIFQPSIFIPRINFGKMSGSLNAAKSYAVSLNNSPTRINQRKTHPKAKKSFPKSYKNTENNEKAYMIANDNIKLNSNKQNIKALEDIPAITDDNFDRSDSDSMESTNDLENGETKVYTLNKINNNFQDNYLSTLKKLESSKNLEEDSESNKNLEDDENFMIDSDADTVVNKKSDTNLKNQITSVVVLESPSKSSLINSNIKKLSPVKRKIEPPKQELNQDILTEKVSKIFKEHDDSKPMSHVTNNVISNESKILQDNPKKVSTNGPKFIQRSKSTIPNTSNMISYEQTNSAEKDLKRARSITPLIPSSITQNRPRSATPKRVTFNDPLVMPPSTSRGNTPKILKPILDTQSVNILIPKPEKPVTKKLFENDKTVKNIPNNKYAIKAKKSNSEDKNLIENDITCQRHICGICGEELTSKEHADAHVKKHKTNETIKSKPTSNQKGKPKLMRCKRCQAVVEAATVKEHTCFSATYPCTVCRLNFGNRKLLADHSLLHKKSTKGGQNSEKNHQNKKASTKYSCFLCDKIVCSDEEMKEHLALHCSSDNEQSKEKVKEPQQLHSNSENEYNFQCAVCGEIFDTEESLEVHISHHIEENDSYKGEYKCTECMETFETTLLLAMHLATHEEEEEQDKFFDQDMNEGTDFSDGFVCTICDEVFDTAEELSVHSDDHKGDRIHVCILCEKKFSSVNDLREHVSSHLNNKKN